MTHEQILSTTWLNLQSGARSLYKFFRVSCVDVQLTWLTASHRFYYQLHQHYHYQRHRHRHHRRCETVASPDCQRSSSSEFQTSADRNDGASRYLNMQYSSQHDITLLHLTTACRRTDSPCQLISTLYVSPVVSWPGRGEGERARVPCRLKFGLSENVRNFFSCRKSFVYLGLKTPDFRKILRQNQIFEHP